LKYGRIIVGRDQAGFVAAAGDAFATEVLAATAARVKV